MPKIKTHNEDCIRLLGRSFEHVHKWLDKFAEKYPVSLRLEYHRQFRHNQRGIDFIKEKWGKEAELAAMLHIIRDNDEYLTLPTIDIYTIDQIEKSYKQAINFCHPLRQDWKKYIY